MAEAVLHPPGSPTHFLSLDGMRGLLSFGVVLFHFGFNSFVERKLGWRGLSFRLCVDVFFLLSGYVLTHAARRGIRPGTFLVKRVFRLLPVYYVTTLVLMLAVNHPVRAKDWALIAPFFGRQLANAPAWSICAEFFLPVAAVALALRVPDRLVWPLLMATLIGLGWMVMPLAQLDGGHLVRGLLGLLGGHLLYRTGADCRWPFLPLFAALIVLMAAAMYWPLAAFVLPLVACLAILCGRQDRGLLGTVPFQLLGDISYTVYLAHWPVLMALGYWYGTELDGNPSLKLGGIVLSLAFAVLLTVLVERPAMRLGSRLLRIMRAPGPVSGKIDL